MYINGVISVCLAALYHVKVYRVALLQNNRRGLESILFSSLGVVIIYHFAGVFYVLIYFIIDPEIAEYVSFNALLHSHQYP